MSFSGFIKNLFGAAEDAGNAVEMPENNTRHPNPIYDNLPGNLFKKEFQASKGAVLLDVRTPMEVRSGALPGAIAIDIMSSSFASKIAALDRSKTYFVYCRSGNRSAQACQIMHRQGFDVRNLMGGIGAWPR